MADDELEQLLHALRSSDDGRRESVVLRLGQYGPAAIQPLTAMLAENDVDIRWWAARALAEVGGDGAVPALVETLADADPDVRACAALALGRIGGQPAVTGMGGASSALAARLADESAFVAGIAADALSMIGEPAVDALGEMLANPNAHTRLLAVRALGRIKAQRTIGPLFGALEDRSYLVRYYAQEALEALGVGMVYFLP